MSRPWNMLPSSSSIALDAFSGNAYVMYASPLLRLVALSARIKTPVRLPYGAKCAALDPRKYALPGDSDQWRPKEDWCPPSSKLVDGDCVPRASV